MSDVDFWFSFELPEGRYYGCGVCGAVVEDDNMERHRVWHASLAATPPVGGGQHGTSDR